MNLFLDKDTIDKVVTILSVFFLVIYIPFISCTDNKDKLGLQTIDNLCFTTDGGNTSDQLYANQDWEITLSAGASEWFTVSPKSGAASSNNINMIFTAIVNNNPDSRSATLYLTIGNKKFIYSISQDGTTVNECTN
ncbi:MAG: BACON domain-containing protein [Bacteroidales bacterium]|nr:BACON domain-containing protein [Bacteroidales bacterium]